MSGHVEQNLEEKVKLLEAQLIAAQRLTSLGELASTITHEFNNILTTTINYAKMGLRHQDDATREKAFQKILSAGQRAAKMTSSILAIARKRGDKMEATEVAPIIEETLVLLEREMTKYRIAVEKNFQPAPPALINGNQIQQVLLNLLINARQAISSGGTIWISVKHDEDAGTVDVTVRDNGSGIPAEKLPKIFDSFFTTKTPDASGKGGTGLGLSMCKNIIESHKGRIRVESTVGKGTAFTLKLPVAKCSPGLPISCDAPAASRVDNGCRQI